jgi:dolichol-phosphate mannosyltransferase
MQISVIMPVYSETNTISEITEELLTTAGDRILEIIIIVSPKSQPETFTVCENLKKKYSFVHHYLQKNNPGMGRAYREGFELAQGTHVLMIDGDGEMPVDTVKLMLDKMDATGCDMVIGSRWMSGGGAIGYDRTKYFLNRVFQFMFRVILRTNIHDLTLGYKLMKAEIAHSLPWSGIHTNFAAETTMFPIKMGYRVTEVPTVWKKRSSGVSKNNFRRNFLYVSTAFDVIKKSGKLRKSMRKIPA